MQRGEAALENHLELKIRLNDDCEYKNLYKWCLQEFDDDENQVGSDQIPWHWTSYLTGTELIYKTSVSSDYLSDDEKDPSHPKPLKVEEVIFGTLRPGSISARDWGVVATFSIFGTNRTIRHFDLHITKLEGDNSLEGCRIWGCASSTLEIDFREETTDDQVEVQLLLSEDKFDRIADMIRKLEVDAVQLRLRGVSGFYSDWSPSIYTTHVKLLVSEPEQEVICGKDCEIVPPRLGEVREFDLEIIRRHKLGLQQTLYGSSNDKPEGPIGVALEKYLERHLPKPPKDESTSSHFYSQFNEIAKAVAKSVAEYSQSRGESSERFEDRLNDAFDVLTSIRYATNEKTHIDWSEEEEGEGKKAEREKAEHTIWHHGETLFAFQKGYESEYAKKVDVENLEQEARRYLTRPWMENGELERIIVDAIAFSEVVSFGEELKQHAPGPVTFLDLNPAYFSAKGNLIKMGWKQFQYGLTKLVVKAAIFIGGPIALGWYFWNRGHEDQVIIGGAAYVGLVVLYFVYRILRRVFGKKPKTILEKGEDLLVDMHGAYGMLKGPVVSPTAAREQFLDTARRGAVWSGVIFSMLDHAIQRSPALWDATEHDTYRY